MITYSFIIGSCDDFETGDDLLQYFLNGGGSLNASRFDYDLPDNASDEAILNLMMDGDYTNLVRTFDKYFGEFVILETRDEELLEDA